MKLLKGWSTNFHTFSRTRPKLKDPLKVLKSQIFLTLGSNYTPQLTAKANPNSNYSYPIQGNTTKIVCVAKIWGPNKQNPTKIHILEKGPTGIGFERLLNGGVNGELADAREDPANLVTAVRVGHVRFPHTISVNSNSNGVGHFRSCNLTGIVPTPTRSVAGSKSSALCLYAYVGCPLPWYSFLCLSFRLRSYVLTDRDRICNRDPWPNCPWVCTNAI